MFLGFAFMWKCVAVVMTIARWRVIALGFVYGFLLTLGLF
jgi:hypothetical protein